VWTYQLQYNSSSSSSSSSSVHIPASAAVQAVKAVVLAPAGWMLQQLALHSVTSHHTPCHSLAPCLGALGCCGRTLSCTMSAVAVAISIVSCACHRCRQRCWVSLIWVS
jgi:hypothetical protein